MSTKAFLTGATGIVGSHILIELLKQGRQVRVLMRENASKDAIYQLLGFHQLMEENIEYVQGDLLDYASLQLGMAGCEEVYHCAAQVSFHPKDRYDMLQINVLGTRNMVDAALESKVSRFCYLSSTAAIGDQHVRGKLAESSPWTTDRGKTGYSMSKRKAELEVWRGRQEGLQALILNPALIIGPGKWGESSTSLLMSCRKGMRFYPSGTNGFVAAKDVARFALEGMKHGWFEGRYLLVGENMGFREAFTMMCQAFGSPAPSVAFPKPLAMAAKRVLRSMERWNLNPFGLTSQSLASAYRKTVYDNQQALDKGFEFTPIQEAIKETVEIYRRRSELIAAFL